MNLQINSPEFAYLIGNFMADGCFYKNKERYRFEFTDGSPYKSELKYSFEHLSHIKSILENFLDKKLPLLKSRGNRYVLYFEDKNLTDIFTNIFRFLPGDKSRIIDIPKNYKNSKYEVDFWRGYLDGDGSIARKSRKISVESMSNFIISSFADFLNRNNIYFSCYSSKRGDDYSYVIVIRSISFRDFANKIGFYHPLKLKLLKEKLKDSDFFKQNKINMGKNGELINYTEIFDNTVFLYKGVKLLRVYGDIKYHQTENVRLQEAVSFLRNKALSDREILKTINSLRFKKGKGSNNSIKLPLYLTNDLLKIAKFVRLRYGGITFSKAYIISFNEDFNRLLTMVERIFDIKPVYTCKNEPIFCSGVLRDFFNYYIESEPKLIKERV